MQLCAKTRKRLCTCLYMYMYIYIYIYIYIACNFELKLGKGYVHVCICTCTGNDRQKIVKGRKKLHCLSLGRHDFIYVPTPQCCYYALLTESV